MRTTWDSSRRVGVWAARKRAAPARIRAPSSDPAGQALELAHGGLVGLEPVELGVLVEQRVAEGGDGPPPGRRRRRGSGGRSRRRRRRGPPGPSTPGAPARSRRPARPGAAAGQAGGGDVEEPVEVDPQRAVVDAAQQRGRRRPHQRLVQGVGGGEGVVHLVPVGVVVLGVEAGDPQRRGEGEGAAQLLGPGAGVDGLVDGGHDLGGVLGEHRPGQPGDTAVVVEAVAAGAGRQPLGEGGRGRARSGRRGRGGSARRPAPRCGTRRPSGPRAWAGRRRPPAQPRWSSASNALFVKSSVWPPSRKTWSVTAENMTSATASASSVGMAEARVRSAASAARVSTKRRYQASSRSAGRAPSRGSSGKRGG